MLSGFGFRNSAPLPGGMLLHLLLEQNRVFTSFTVPTTQSASATKVTNAPRMNIILRIHSKVDPVAALPQEPLAHRAY